MKNHRQNTLLNYVVTYIYSSNTVAQDARERVQNKINMKATTKRKYERGKFVKALCHYENNTGNRVLNSFEQLEYWKPL